MRLLVYLFYLIGLTTVCNWGYAQDYQNWPVVDTVWFEDNEDKISSIEYTNPLKIDQIVIEEFYDDGSLKAQKHYHNHGLESEWAEMKFYYPTESYMLRQMKHHFYSVGLGFKDTLKSWWPDGTLKRLEIYRDDKLVSGQSFDEEGKEVQHVPYMRLPSYPGGIDALRIFLRINVKYPPKLRRKKLSGRVLASFIIDTDGSLNQIKIVDSPHKLFSKEVIRVLEEMPNWNPGFQDGEPVKVHYNLPVNFSL